MIKYNRVYISLAALIISTTIICEAQACRFWCAVGDRVPKSVIVEQLLDAPESLKSLGQDYRDGWAVGYYNRKEFEVFRGAGASNEDNNYNVAVNNIALEEPHIVLGHLRRASSGCVEGVPNPHPFIREKMGKVWTFGHNGGIKKEILIDLIGEEYLGDNPPYICNDNPPDTWIDSELYFIFFLKSIEASQGDVEKGLILALKKLYEIIPPEHHYFNFFLSDSKAIWAYRKGTSLFYLEDSKNNIAAVSSTAPEGKRNWKEFPLDTLARLEEGKSIEFIPLFK